MPLRGDEEFGTIGSGSTRLLHQGTEMVDVGWPLAGGGTGGRPADDCPLGRSFASLPGGGVRWGGGRKLPESSEEAGKRDTLCTQG